MIPAELLDYLRKTLPAELLDYLRKTLPAELLDYLRKNPGHDLIEALLDEGPSPSRHREIIRRHRAEAPEIWSALFRVAILLARSDSDRARLWALREATDSSEQLRQRAAARRAAESVKRQR